MPSLFFSARSRNQSRSKRLARIAFEGLLLDGPAVDTLGQFALDVGLEQVRKLPMVADQYDDPAAGHAERDEQVEGIGAGRLVDDHGLEGRLTFVDPSYAAHRLAVRVLEGRGQHHRVVLERVADALGVVLEIGQVGGDRRFIAGAGRRQPAIDSVEDVEQQPLGVVIEANLGGRSHLREPVDERVPVGAPLAEPSGCRLGLDLGASLEERALVGREHRIEPAQRARACCSPIIRERPRIDPDASGGLDEQLRFFRVTETERPPERRRPRERQVVEVRRKQLPEDPDQIPRMRPACSAAGDRVRTQARTSPRARDRRSASTGSRIRARSCSSRSSANT